ncbi:FAD-dependent monooxygenase [Streptomyces sp. NPDC086519]
MLVVGAGPVGLTAANLLGALGVRVLAVERPAPACRRVLNLRRRSGGQ